MLCVLVDDVRRFLDDRDCVVYRTSRDAVCGLTALAEADTVIDQLWLDHDLGADDTIRPALALLEELAYQGRPLRVGKAFVITSNPTGGHVIGGLLRRLGYHCDPLPIDISSPPVRWMSECAASWPDIGLARPTSA